MNIEIIDETIQALTQRVGASGFNTERYAEKNEIDWLALIQLPKFQMFVVEKTGKDSSKVMDWIYDYVQSQCNKDAEALFQEYLHWHQLKGYWPDEDVFGQPLKSV